MVDIENILSIRLPNSQSKWNLLLLKMALLIQQYLIFIKIVRKAQSITMFNETLKFQQFPPR